MKDRLKRRLDLRRLIHAQNKHRRIWRIIGIILFSTEERKREGEREREKKLPSIGISDIKLHIRQFMFKFVIQLSRQTCRIEINFAQTFHHYTKNITN